jgi:OTU domain-containing protein 6
MGQKKGGGGGGGGGGPTFDPADVASETWEAMTARHASETAVVEAHCASMTGKKDRDTKMRLEGEVRDRHYREIAAWESIHEDAGTGSASASSDEGEGEGAKTPSPPTAAMARASVGDDGVGDDDVHGGGGPTTTKAMKRRAKKEREEREREEAKEIERANAGPSDAARESDALKKKLAPRGLSVKEVKADGNCMYRAVEDQLKRRGMQSSSVSSSMITHDHAALRKLCADAMREDAWSYRPFLEACAEASAAGDAAWREYLREVEDVERARWGGQLELRALSDALGRSIRVYSAHMPDVVMGGEGEGEAGGGRDAAAIEVCYHRHAFGLGEHYNSVVDAT